MRKRRVAKQESGARIYPKFRKEIAIVSQDKLQGAVVRKLRQMFPGIPQPRRKRVR